MQEQVADEGRIRGEFATLSNRRAVKEASFARRVQGGQSYRVVPPKGMMEHCMLDSQGALVDPRLIKGIEPVVVQGPAIILQRATEGQYE